MMPVQVIGGLPRALFEVLVWIDWVDGKENGPYTFVDADSVVTLMRNIEGDMIVAPWTSIACLRWRPM